MGYYRRMRTRAKAVRLGGALALAAALAACQAGPPPPLLSPVEQAKRYGYAERELAPDRVEVTYMGPRRRVASIVPTARDADTQPARTEAVDFALWRAAQIALARGFEGFRVVDRQITIDSQPDAFYPGPEGAAWPYWRYPGGFIYGPPGFAATPYLSLQVHAVLTVQLVHDLQPGDEAAGAAIERLRGAHPGAAG
jgi:hypothetical protein